MTPATIITLAQFAITYGIPAAEKLIALFKKPDATVADVEALFAEIKTYEQYQIPALQPFAVPQTGSSKTPV